MNRAGICAAFALACASAASAQTVSIVSGNGQLVGQQRPAASPVVVLVRDASGKPLPGAAVSWTVSQTGGVTLVGGSQTTTDANGQASNTFIGTTINPPVSFIPSTITATVGSSSVDFAVTTYDIDSTLVNYVQSTLLSPTLDNPLPVGQSGSPGTVPIQVTVRGSAGSQSGLGVPNVVVTLVPENSAGPTITCKEGVVLTNTTGSATCTPLYGGLGSGSFTINVGGIQNFTNNRFQVVPGPPGMFVISGGTAFSANPGQALPTLIATVADAAGNPLSNVPVVFEAVPAGSVVFSNVRSPSDANGRVSAVATLSNTAINPVQIRLRTTDGAVLTTFTVTVNVTISGLQKISGDGQSAFQNTAFGQPLVVQVTDANGKPLQGAGVTFAVSQGSATVGTANATTDVNGRASTAVAAGPTAGAVVLTASAGAFSATFNLTVSLPGPMVTSASFANGASFVQGSLSPGSIVTINGGGLVQGLNGSVSGTSLIGLFLSQVAGVQVMFGSVPAPIYNVTSNNGLQSVTVQVPFETPPGPATVTVSAGGGGSTSVQVNVLPLSPGIFEANDPGDNVRRAVVLRPNGSVVTAANRAAKGETLRMFATGLGQTNPAVGTNQFSPLGIDPAVNAPVVVGVNNSGVNVVQSIYARNLIGVYEVQFVVPSDAPSGAGIPLALAIQGSDGNLVFAAGSLLSVQ